MRRDVVAVVPVFDQRCLASFVLRVGETWDEHTPGQCICTMRRDGAAGCIGEIVDCLRQLRFRRIAMHIKDETAAAFKATEPDLTAALVEPPLRCLLTAPDRSRRD